jgi:hypothetical protein
MQVLRKMKRLLQKNVRLVLKKIKNKKFLTIGVPNSVERSSNTPSSSTYSCEKWKENS